MKRLKGGGAIGSIYYSHTNSCQADLLCGRAEICTFTTNSLHFQTKVTFGHKLHYEIKIMFGEISLKLRHTNWNVVRINVNVIVDELSSQMTVYTCLKIDIWIEWRRCTSTRFCALQCHPPKMVGF